MTGASSTSGSLGLRGVAITLLHLRTVNKAALTTFTANVRGPYSVITALPADSANAPDDGQKLYSGTLSRAVKRSLALGSACSAEDLWDVLVDARLVNAGNPCVKPLDKRQRHSLIM